MECLSPIYWDVECTVEVLYTSTPDSVALQESSAKTERSAICKLQCAYWFHCFYITLSGPYWAHWAIVIASKRFRRE